MTVKQLINLLQKFPPDKIIEHVGSEWTLDITSVVETPSKVYLSPDTCKGNTIYPNPVFVKDWVTWMARQEGLDIIQNLEKEDLL